MARVSLVEADDEVAKFRLRKPHRHLPPQHAALARIVRAFAVAFAGDDKRNFSVIRLGPTQEGKQRSMRLPLRHAMQIDASVDGVAATRDALLEPAFEWRERKRFSWRRRWMRRGRSRRRAGFFAGNDVRFWRCFNFPQWREGAGDADP